ncbi:hypothetical protein DW846_12895 [Ruminococcus sp. AM36-2AA]|nr:hypothetical protein [Ruminococcus sp.]RGH47302.1 hypothetical protein DW894_10875 [Ruminococcus sp. AM41-10BH]RGH49464.1 hypothetical protein DW851_12930 [Ruminococcus sp. AM36-5]RGH55890.1 hypothetical protein DW846_12895 [Ruminococcus sp. AM36-2AA]RGI22902.1 hypothetical protein DXC28_10860 [Ruminococcus sp. OM08-9BH]HBB47307.1 hypothetical protein [Blautia sp.]
MHKSIYVFFHSISNIQFFSLFTWLLNIIYHFYNSGNLIFFQKNASEHIFLKKAQKPGPIQKKFCSGPGVLLADFI